ncbi:hypothetical protein HGRIS_014434 [Hohenbuehelia grisea]|uniref:Zinc-finger domain-containing protein n=1 Tax=Hohenbuehelia grisea TaxID=104357 RepID=A0ABR3JVN8_9AGAR
MSSLLNWDGKFGLQNAASRANGPSSSSNWDNPRKLRDYTGCLTTEADSATVYNASKGSHDASQPTPISQITDVGQEKSLPSIAESSVGDASDLFDVEEENMDAHSEDAEGEDDDGTFGITTISSSIQLLAEYVSSPVASPMSSPLFTPVAASPVASPPKRPLFLPSRSSSPTSVITISDSSSPVQCLTSSRASSPPPSPPKRLSQTKTVFLSHIQMPSLPAGLRASDYMPARRCSRLQTRADHDQTRVGDALNAMFQQNAQLGEIQVHSKKPKNLPGPSVAAPLKRKYNRVASTILNEGDHRPAKKKKTIRLPKHQAMASPSTEASLLAPFPTLDVPRPSYVALVINTRFVGTPKVGSMRADTMTHIREAIQRGVGSSHKSAQSGTWFHWPPPSSLELLAASKGAKVADDLSPGPPVLLADEAIGDVDAEEEGLAPIGSARGPNSVPTFMDKLIVAKKRKLVLKDRPAFSTTSRLPHAGPSDLSKMSMTSTPLSSSQNKTPGQLSQKPGHRPPAPTTSSPSNRAVKQGPPKAASKSKSNMRHDTTHEEPLHQRPSEKALGKRKAIETSGAFPTGSSSGVAAPDFSVHGDLTGYYETFSEFVNVSPVRKTATAKSGCEVAPTVPCGAPNSRGRLSPSTIDRTLQRTSLQTSPSFAHPPLSFRVATPQDDIYRSRPSSPLHTATHDDDIYRSRPPSPFHAATHDDDIYRSRPVTPSLASPVAYSARQSEQRETLYYNPDDFLSSAPAKVSPSAQKSSTASGNPDSFLDAAPDLTLSLPELHEEHFNGTTINPSLLDPLGFGSLLINNDEHDFQSHPSPIASRPPSLSPVVSSRPTASTSSNVFPVSRASSPPPSPVLSPRLAEDASSYSPSRASSRSPTPVAKPVSQMRVRSASPKASAPQAVRNNVADPAQLSSNEEGVGNGRGEGSSSPSKRHVENAGPSFGPAVAGQAHDGYIFPPRGAKGQVLVIEAGSRKGTMSWPLNASQAPYYCHQCRTKSQRIRMICSCGKSWCIRCTLTRYDGIVAFDASLKDYSNCPCCSGTCNCDLCCARRGDTYKKSSRATTFKPVLLNETRRTKRPPKPKKNPFADDAMLSHHEVALASGSAQPATWLPPLAPPPSTAVKYWGTIYGIDGRTVGRAYTATDGGNGALYALPVRPARRRVFIGAIQDAWKLGPNPTILDLAPTPAVLRKGSTGRTVSYVGDKSVLRMPCVDDPESGEEDKRAMVAFSWFWEEGELTEVEDDDDEAEVLNPVEGVMDAPTTVQGVAVTPEVPNSDGGVIKPPTTVQVDDGNRVEQSHQPMVDTSPATALSNEANDESLPTNDAFRAPTQELVQEQLGAPEGAGVVLSDSDVARAIGLGLGQVGIRTSMSLSPED